MFKKLLLAIVFTLGSVNAFAVPALQLYMPDGVYYETNPWGYNSDESWVTTSNPFELVVAGASSGSINYIDNVTLYMALLSDEDLSGFDADDVLITITELSKDILVSDFTYGKPDELSSHGIYDTHYASVALPDLLVLTAGETVYDYNKDFDPDNPTGGDSGDIQNYTISYDSDISFIHFDLSGDAHKGNGKIQGKFAPYSHDADVPPPTVIPEPTSLFLLGSGLLGLAGAIRRRRT